MSSNSPSTCFGNAVSSGTQTYNGKRHAVPATQSWNSYVKQNYHAAKQTSGLNHKDTMKSLGSYYTNNKSNIN